MFRASKNGEIPEKRFDLRERKKRIKEKVGFHKGNEEKERIFYNVDLVLCLNVLFLFILYNFYGFYDNICWL